MYAVQYSVHSMKYVQTLEQKKAKTFFGQMDGETTRDESPHRDTLFSYPTSPWKNATSCKKQQEVTSLPKAKAFLNEID